MTELRDRNILVTGAASGIGRRLAEKIHARGGRLLLWDRDAEGLASLGRDLEARGGGVWSAVCDVTDRDAVAETARRTLAECGPVEVLVNNAGVVSGKTLLDASDDEIQRTLDVNLLSLFWVTRAFLPAMVERNRGHVVTIASAAGLVGVSKLVDYCASKFGAVGFDEALRLELARRDLAIRTTVVCPFYVNTGMFDGVRTRIPWLLPILDVETVTDRIVRAVERNRRRLLLPWVLYTVGPLRLLPPRLFDAVLRLLGVNESMDAFRGRTAKPSD